MFSNRILKLKILNKYFRCTNNFGPFQFPEKLIPLSIKKSLNNKPIELYGDGKNKRDWIFVEDP